MGFFSPASPERKYIRPDTAIDQRTFDEVGEEVSIDNSTHDQTWVDVLSLGIPFGRNIADILLGKAVQKRRGEILVTRSENSQDTRAIPYRAKRHELPRVTLTHRETRENLPRENERRSLETARHGRHSREYTPIPDGITLSPNQRLAAGGFQSNLGREYKLRALAEDQEAARLHDRTARRKSQPPSDDIPF